LRFDLISALADARLRAIMFCFASTLALAAPLVAGVVSVPAAYAGPIERVAHFDIPAQPLSTALLEFARQAPAEILLSADALAGVTSRDARGDLTPSAALPLLLRCTGFEGWLEGGVVRVRRAPAAKECDGRAPLVA
jgi:hypothetical protein